jgi:cardiolipin synthase
MPRATFEQGARLERGVHDPQLRRLLSRIDQAPLLPGVSIEPFYRGEAALAAMLAAIGAASVEVLLQSYILRDDWTGERVARALIDAAQRGVVVRLLVDAFGSSATKRSYWAHLRRRGVNVRQINNLMPALWWGKTYRDHRKLLVVDRQLAFTGGMNLGDEYSGSSREPGWRDTHARFDGAAAWEMAIVFRESWESAGGSHFEIEPRGAEPGAGGADVLILDSRPLRGHHETAAVLAAVVGAARESIWLTAAYFAPRRLAIDLLLAAQRRGVDVRLLLPGRTDVPLVRHAGHGFFAELLHAGVRLFEYQPAVLHAKTILIDRTLAMIGSSNLDFRSFHLNAECNALCFDPRLGASLALQFERDLVESVEQDSASWSARSFWHRCGDLLAKRLAWAL